MAFTPNVLAGEKIQSAWGNEIRDRTVQVFATAAERAAQWPNPPKGALSFQSDSSLLYIYSGTAWVGLDVAQITAWSGSAWIRLNPTGIPGIQTSGGLRLTNGSGVYFDMGGGFLFDGPVGSAGLAVSVNGYPADNVWTSKTIRLNALNPAAGLCGMAFHTQAYGDVIQIQAYRPPAGQHGFHFVNITNSATVHCTAAAWNVASAARFKDEIAPYEGDALGVVNELEVITYKPKPHPGLLEPEEGQPAPPPAPEPTTQIGLLAENIEPVIPEAVAYDEEGLYSYNLVTVVSLLTKAVQELTARIEALEGGTAA